MQAGALPASLTPEQHRAAVRGLKAMVPIGGHPFLAHILSDLADAGFRQVCLVLSPDREEILRYLRTVPRSRISVESVVQDRPLGTADAVLAGERFAAGDPVVVVNGDNRYPVSGLAALRQLPGAGLLGFRLSTLITRGNIPVERITAFALLETDTAGHLTRLVEKPSAGQVAGFGADPLVSMNAWLLPPAIRTACRAISPSPRGELELADAVRYAMVRMNQRFPVVESVEGVLDLSTAADIPEVERRLSDHEVRL